MGGKTEWHLYSDMKEHNIKQTLVDNHPSKYATKSRILKYVRYFVQFISDQISNIPLTRLHV